MARMRKQEDSESVKLGVVLETGKPNAWFRERAIGIYMGEK